MIFLSFTHLLPSPAGWHATDAEGQPNTTLCYEWRMWWPSSWMQSKLLQQFVRGKLPYTQQNNACRPCLLHFTLRKWAPALSQVTPGDHIHSAQAQQWPQSRQTFGMVRVGPPAGKGSGHAKNKDVPECISPHIQNWNEELRQNFAQKPNGKRRSLSGSLQTSSTLATAEICPRCDGNAMQHSAVSIRAWAGWRPQSHSNV